MNILQGLAGFFTLVLIFALPNLSSEAGLNIAGVSLVKIAGSAAFGLSVLPLLGGRNVRAVADFHSVVVLYVAWVMFSFLWTAMPEDYEITQAIDAQQALKNNVYVLMLCWLLFQVVDVTKHLMWGALVFVFGSFWLVFLLYQSASGGGNADRLMIEGYDANEISVQLALAVPFAVYVLLQSRLSVMWIPSLVFVPLASWGVLVSGSRTGGVVLLVALSTLWLVARRHGTGVKVLSVIAVIAGLIGLSTLVSTESLSRMLSVGQEISSGTLNERSVIWGYAYEVWEQQPIFGQGIGSFRRLLNPYHVNYTAHNSFVALAVEQGMIGVILYLSVLFTVLLYALRLPTDLRLLSVALLLIAVLGQFTMTLHDRLYIWFTYAFPVLLYYFPRTSWVPPNLTYQTRIA